MAILDRSLEALHQEQRRPRAVRRPADSLRFDLLSAVLGFAFIFGLYIDGWAHNSGRVDNTFFTPWHGVLYGSYAAGAGVLVLTQFRNVLKGYTWVHAVPRGYTLSLFGVMLFAVGGVGDLLWHEAFGFEQSFNALYSPTHLLLATGGLLMVTGPIRAAWQRPDTAQNWRARWWTLLPALIAVISAYSVLTFFVQPEHLLGLPHILAGRQPSGYNTTSLANIFGVTATLITSLLALCTLLVLLRRWTLPVGSAALMFTINAALMFWLRSPDTLAYWEAYIGMALVGVGVDVLLVILRPSATRPAALRLFMALVPFAIALVTLLGISMPEGLWWEIHLWLGVPFMAGAAGFLLSFIVVPPAQPHETARDGH